MSSGGPRQAKAAIQGASSAAAQGLWSSTAIMRRRRPADAEREGRADEAAAADAEPAARDLEAVVARPREALELEAELGAPPPVASIAPSTTCDSNPRPRAASLIAR